MESHPEAKSPSITRQKFPTYLPLPDESQLKWLAEYLQAVRGNRNTADVAKKSKVKEHEVQAIESGTLNLGLGRLRHILKYGYKQKLEGVLAKCFEAFKGKCDPKGKHPFEREGAYSIFYKESPEGGATPLFVGGDPDRFLWAVPLRQLKKHPHSVDFLELGPQRKLKPSGETFDNVHDGVELVHVINGTVTVSVRPEGAEKSSKWTVDAGASVHFNSKYEHRIFNPGTTTSALLLVVRLPAI